MKKTNYSIKLIIKQKGTKNKIKLQIKETTKEAVDYMVHTMTLEMIDSSRKLLIQAAKEELTKLQYDKH